MSAQRFLDNDKNTLVNYVKNETKNPVNLLNTSFVNMYSQTENVGFEKCTVTSGTTLLDSTHQFVIKLQDSFIGGFVLVLSLLSAGVDAKISEKAAPINSDGSHMKTDENGNYICKNMKIIKENDKGQLINDDRSILTTNSEGNYIYNATKIIKKNKNGQLLDDNGEIMKMNSSGNYYYIEEKLIKKNKDGYIVNDDDTIMAIDKNNNYVDKNGRIIFRDKAGDFGNVSYVSNVGCQIIDTIDIYISGTKVHSYHGYGLFQYLMFANRLNDNGKAMIQTLMTGATGGATPTGLIYIPIVCEGNSGIMSDMIKPFAVGLTKADFMISIKFKKTTDVTLSVPTVAVNNMATAPVIRYYKYLGDINDKRLRGRTGQNINESIYTYKTVDIVDTIVPITLTTGLTDLGSSVISTVFNKSAECLALLILSSLATGDQLIGVTSALIDMKIGNNDHLYQQESLNEGLYNSLVKFGETNLYALTYPQYVIPFVHDVINCLKDDTIMSGINLFNLGATLAISASAAAHNVKVTGVFQTFTNINDDGSCHQLFQYDPTYLNISTTLKINTAEKK